MFKIRPATEADIPVIIDIAEATWWPTYSPILTPEQIRFMLAAIYSPEILRSQMQNGTQRFLVLLEEGKIEGFASFGPRAEHPGVYKIHKLYVLPANHRKGYGRALIDHIKTLSALEGAHKLDLNVNRNNAARHFYEKIGFRIIREEDVPIGPFWMNDYVMQVDIARKIE